MKEIASVIRVINTTLRTVRFMEIAKKVIIASAVGLCCVFAIKLWKRN